jgi:hypothetical protein
MVRCVPAFAGTCRRENADQPRRWATCSRRARAFDIAQLQIGQLAGVWRRAGQYWRPK